MRTIAIGDIHGCNAALAALIDAIRPSKNDTLIQLGDFIDRGPNSRLVIDQLLVLSNHCELVSIRGNHEELLLNAIQNPSELPRWLRNGGADTLISYGCNDPARIPIDHVNFIWESIDYFETARFIFIHAGYVHDKPMNEQSALALRWRTTNENCLPHCSGKIVISGHTAQNSGEIFDLGHVKCIDTNCVNGGWLTALDVESGQKWQANRQGLLRTV